MWWLAAPLRPARRLSRGYGGVAGGPITLAALPALVEGVLARDKRAISRSITLCTTLQPGLGRLEQIVN